MWAAILIWAGLALLADNLGLLRALEKVEGWDLILAGAGSIVLLEVAVRLVVRDYRRPVGGTLTFGLVLLAIGLGGLVNAVWPALLIALGFPVSQPNAPALRPLSEVCFFEEVTPDGEH